MDLAPLARKYLWWQSPEAALQHPHRLIAQIMDIGSHADVEALRMALGDEALRRALREARAGEFSRRSWHYWHLILGGGEAPCRAASAHQESLLNAFPRLEALPAAQRSLWPQLVTVAQDSFVLYGGTAVALYLGHRISVYFDFFTHLPINPDELIGEYPFLRDSEVLQSGPNTLTVITAGREFGGVRMSFFGGLGFGRLAQPRMTPDGVMNVASPDDLLAHKLKTILQRVEIKDYLDVDALLDSGLSLPLGLSGARLLFPAFAPQECLKALTYFEDEALGDLPTATQGRLLAAVKAVRSLPNVSLAAATLGD